MQLFRKGENIQNGIMGASRKTVSAPCPAHQHDFFEIEYILAGGGDYIIDGKTYEAAPGKMFFMTPANFHAVYPKDLELINIMFPCSLDGGGALFRLTEERPTPELTLTGKDAAFCELLAEEIVGAIGGEDYPYAMELLGCLLRKMAYLCEGGEGEPHSYAKRAVLYILENFSKNITLADAARHLGLSKNYLSELFGREIGICFKTYLDNLRFDYVSKLLLFTDISVLTAYEMAGFSDYANFARRFKSRFGLSPSAYRKKKQ